MRKTILQLVFVLTTFIGFSQSENSIIMNDSLVKVYFQDYVEEASNRGHDIQTELLGKLDYILIVPEDVKVGGLAKTNLDNKWIKLDSNVLEDRLMLKINLYRELSYVLGVPYNEGSVIMDRDKAYGFSYAAFDDIDILDIELSKVLALL